jgi:hypothetical protein
MKLLLCRLKLDEKKSDLTIRSVTNEWEKTVMVKRE